jgi:oligosaccharide translocation protein RFT1
MTLFSVIYICSALTMYQLNFGDAALVYANIINLMARIMYSLSFVTIYFNLHKAGVLVRWENVLPSRKFLSLVGLSAVLVRCSDRYLGASDIVTRQGRAAISSPYVLFHIVIGGALGLACALTWWMTFGRLLTLPGRAKTSKRTAVQRSGGVSLR